MQTSRATWIVFHTAPWLLKKLWLLIDHFDSQALMPSLPHEHRLQLAALYTLQHSLTRNTQFCCGYDHGYVLRRRLRHDARPQFIVDANLPRGARCDLLAGDETVGQPAVNTACVHAQKLRCFTNRNQLSAGWLSRRLEARNFAIPSQTADLIGGEAFTCSCLSPLTV